MRGRAALVVLTAMVESVWGQGSLFPSGAPAPNMKSLEQVEPRTAITNIPWVIGTTGSYDLVKSLRGGCGFLWNHP